MKVRFQFAIKRILFSSCTLFLLIHSASAGNTYSLELVKGPDPLLEVIGLNRTQAFTSIRAALDGEHHQDFVQAILAEAINNLNIDSPWILKIMQAAKTRFLRDRVGWRISRKAVDGDVSMNVAKAYIDSVEIEDVPFPFALNGVLLAANRIPSRFWDLSIDTRLKSVSDPRTSVHQFAIDLDGDLIAHTFRATLRSSSPGEWDDADFNPFLITPDSGLVLAVLFSNHSKSLAEKHLDMLQRVERMLTGGLEGEKTALEASLVLEQRAALKRCRHITARVARDPEVVRLKTGVAYFEGRLKSVRQRVAPPEMVSALDEFCSAVADVATTDGVQRCVDTDLEEWQLYLRELKIAQQRFQRAKTAFVDRLSVLFAAEAPAPLEVGSIPAEMTPAQAAPQAREATATSILEEETHAAFEAEWEESVVYQAYVRRQPSVVVPPPSPSPGLGILEYPGFGKGLSAEQSDQIDAFVRKLKQDYNEETGMIRGATKVRATEKILEIRPSHKGAALRVYVVTLSRNRVLLVKFGNKKTQERDIDQLGALERSEEFKAYLSELEAAPRAAPAW